MNKDQKYRLIILIVGIAFFSLILTSAVFRWILIGFVSYFMFRVFMKLIK